MARLYITLFIICIFLTAYPQNQNITDNKGFKQGYWKIYRIDTVYPRPMIVLKFKNDTMNDKVTEEKHHIKNYEVNLTLESEGQYEKSMKQQNWKYYNIENDIESVGYNFSKEIFKGDSAVFHKHYYKGSIIKEANYINDTIDGAYKSYYKNLKLKSVIQFHRGKIVDSVKCYYESGKVYFSGLKILGTEYYEGIEYYESGSVRIVKRYNVDYILSKWINK